ncbi:T9SS type A sorting domain-containing protein [Bacteroidales bacterium OttesenSCG-928-M11]|nr:T9SS type A sorting domain-containing protein [Bacteroidales bacterium OttesenSCG-928-M11]
MERIRQLLLLLVFVLGSSLSGFAQDKLPTVYDVDLDKVDLKIEPTEVVAPPVFTGCANEKNLEFDVAIKGGTGVYSGLTGDEEGWNGRAQRVNVCLRMYYAGGAGNVDVLGLGTYDKNDPNTYLSNLHGASQGIELAQNPVNIDVTMVTFPTMITQPGEGTYTVELYYGDVSQSGSVVDVDCSVVTETFATETIKVKASSAWNVSAPTWEMVYGLDPAAVYKPFTVGGAKMDLQDCAFKISSLVTGLDCEPAFYIGVSYTTSTEDKTATGYTGKVTDVLELGTSTMYFGPFTRTSDGCLEASCEVFEAYKKFASKLGTGVYNASLYMYKDGMTYVDSTPDVSALPSAKDIKPANLIYLHKKPFLINSTYGFKIDMNDMDLVYKAGPVLPKRHDGEYQYCTWGPHRSDCHKGPEHYTTYVEIKYLGEKGDVDVINLGTGRNATTFDINNCRTSNNPDCTPHWIAPQDYPEVAKVTTGIGVLKTTTIRYGCGTYTAQLVHCRADGSKYYASDTTKFEICGHPPVTIEVEDIDICKDPVCPDPLVLELNAKNLIDADEYGNKTTAYLRVKKTSGDKVLYSETVILGYSTYSALGTYITEISLDNRHHGRVILGTGRHNHLRVEFDTYDLGEATYEVNIYENKSFLDVQEKTNLAYAKTFNVNVTCCDFIPEDLAIVGRLGDFTDAVLDLITSEDMSSIETLIKLAQSLAGTDLVDVPEELWDVIGALNKINFDGPIYDVFIAILNVVDLYGLIPEKVCIGSPFANLYIPLFTTYKDELVCPYGASYALVHVDGDEIIDFNSFVGGLFNGNKISEDGKTLYISNNVLTGGSVGMFPGNFYLFTTTLTTEGKGTYKFVPVVANGKGILDLGKPENCGTGEVGVGREFTIDVRKPLSDSMLANTDKVFYRTNGSDPFGPIDLTNETLSKNGNPIADVVIYDIDNVIGRIEDFNGLSEYNPFYFNGANVYVMIGLEVDEESGAIKLPKIILENDTNVQQPLKIGYSIRYSDNFYCCEGEEGFPFADIFDGPQSLLDKVTEIVNDRLESAHKNWIWGCAAGSFYIVVKPADNAVNQDLVATPVQVAPICFGDDATFEAQFGAKYHEKDIFENGEALPTGVTVSYRVNWIGGDEIVDLTDDNNLVDETGLWTPSATKEGKGIYTVTPVFSENMTLSNGVPVSFTLIAREGLSTDMIAFEEQTFVYTNGTVVPAITIDTNAPSGATLTWEVVTEDDYVNVGTLESGKGTIPAFIAYNNGVETITSKIKVSLSYGEGDEDSNCEDAVVYFYIQVTPKVLNADELIAQPVEGIVLCGIEDTYTFNVAADYQGETAPEETTFTVEFVSGDDVATFEADGIAEDGALTWTATTKYVGKGTYAVIPTLLGTRGVPAYFTIEVRDLLTSDMVGIFGQNLRYNNGDKVPSISLDTNLPAGAVVSWNLVTSDEEDAVNVSVGTTTSGNRTIPTFVATNYGTEAITAEYAFTISYEDGECEIAEGTFSITVDPYVIEDRALIASYVTPQVICDGEDFVAAELEAYHYFYDTEDAQFRIEFAGGDMVAQIPSELQSASWTIETTGVIGIGTYRAVPILNNAQGVAVTFTLEVREALATDMIGLHNATFNYQNGEAVPAISLDALLPQGAIISWLPETEIDLANAKAIGMNATTGNALVPSFVAKNTTDENITATFIVTVAYGTDCPATGKFTITVAPSTIEDNDLVMNPVEGQQICSTSEFGAVEFEAVRTDAETFEGAVSYVVSFVGGTNVVDLTAGNTVTAEEDATWTPTGAVDNLGKPVIGKGTYRVTPTWNNGQGVPVLFTLEVVQALDAKMVGLKDQTLSFLNGDRVSGISLDAQLPTGATLTWKLVSNEETLVKVGTATAGTATIPSFVATNLTGATVTAKYEYTISYADGACDAATGNFYISVIPNQIEDTALNAVAFSQTICENDNFAKVAIHSLYVYNGIVNLNNVTYHIEFVSGVQVVSPAAGNVASWTPEKNGAIGIGTYRATPILENKRGVPAIFTLEVLKAASADMVGIDGAAFNYQNGETVHAINLDATLPAETKVTWEVVEADKAKAAAIGLNAIEGNAIVPSFVAINTTDADITVNLKATLASKKTTCDSEATFSITVAPNTIEDYDLVMNPVADQRVCNDANNGFAKVEFKATRTDAEAFTAGTVNYVVSYVGGTPVADLTSNYKANAVAGLVAEWTPTQAVDLNGTPLAGTGIYRVTPTWNNGQGVPVLFTLTTYPLLDNSMLDIANMVFSNGDYVAQYNFNASNLPAGATIAWEYVSGAKIGTPNSGVNRIPAFTAINTTKAAVTATYKVWLENEGCDTSADAKTFTITVNPKVLVDTDLHVVSIADQIVCNTAAFANITLKAEHRFETVGNTVEFEFVLTDGIDVIGLGNEGVVGGTANPFTWNLSAQTGRVVGTGVYQVTPIYNSNSGTPTTFTLTRIQAPEADQIADVVLCNGEGLDITFTSKHKDTEFDWEVATADQNKLTGLAKSGSNVLQANSLTHSGDKAVTVTINVTPRNANQELDCEGAVMSFKVTVNPVVKMEYIANIAVASGTKVGKDEARSIKFEGNATSYKWTSSNPAIYEGLEANSQGTVEADENGVAYLPTFIAANYTKDIITSKVTVTPSYEGCEGEPVEFYILVGDINGEGIVLEYMADQEACHGDVVAPISFNLPLSSYYFVTWTSDVNIGLADGTLEAKSKNLPQFTAVAQENGTKLTVSTITVTPHVYYNGVKYDGQPMSFKFTVYPAFEVENDNTVEVVTIEISACPDAEIAAIELTVDPMEAVTYQWYKNQTIIPSETKNVYKRTNVSLVDAGDYYCVMTARCGSARSKIFRVIVTEMNNDVIVEQLWNDVLQVNCILNENGGFTYTKYSWYYCENGVKAGAVSYADGSSWIRINASDLNKEFIVEATDLTGTVHTSCPVSLIAGANKVTISAFPSPVEQGGEVTAVVTGVNEGTIQVVNSTGNVVNSIPATESETVVRMPYASGVYVLRVIPAEGSTAEVKVIVK